MKSEAEGRLKVSAPGRICLFGEHQDYLGLPVITAAIDLNITIYSHPRKRAEIHLHLPDIGSEEMFPVSREVGYRRTRDYFRSVYNQLYRQGYPLRHGLQAEVRGNIPINSGTSSSSALCVAWMRTLMEWTGHPQKDDPLAVARLAHQAEVVEFKEPGGMMDHLASAFGGLQYIEFFPRVQVEALPKINGYFILGDSQEPKDTVGVLARAKEPVVRALEKITRVQPDFHLRFTSPRQLKRYRELLEPQEYRLCQAALRNRNLTLQARDLFLRGQMTPAKLGEMLNALQDILRDELQVSTPKIERLIRASLQAGALGGKINGSGGGGCMFVYTKSEPEKVAEAIRREGGVPYVLRVGEGVRVERTI